MKAGAADTDERRTAHLPDGGSSGIVRDQAQFPGTTHGIGPFGHTQLVEELAKMTECVEQPLAAPGRTARQRGLQMALQAALGVDLTAIPTIGVETALTIAAEIGPDLSRFPSSKHFCSWLTLTPGTRISGGKSLKGRMPKRSNRAGQAVRLAASSARHNHSIIGACHRARLRRLDPPRAIKATAHQLARLIYAMLTRGEAYVEKGIEHFETERRDRQVRYPQRQARHFNLAPVEIEQVA